MGADANHRAVFGLSSGRQLTYSAVGPADGSPVIYCHGAIGTPVAASIDLASITADLGIRHIAVNRPGIGGSQPLPGRRVVDFADDILQLADALSLERFAVVGVSAGGPYALAVAHRLPDRVRRVALCSSMAPICPPHRAPEMRPWLRVGLGALIRAPGACSAAGDRLLPLIRRRPGLITAAIAAHAAQCERSRLRGAQEQAAAISSFLDATANGIRGMVDDYAVTCRGWGFSAAEVETEVHLWHGVRDPVVPLEHALQLAISLPHCRVFLDPDEGHHFFRSRLRTILARLGERTARAPG